MACPLPADQLKNLRVFIELCKQDPDVLHMNELVFFKNYIESLGGVVPAKKASDKKEEKDEKPRVVEPEPQAEEADEVESVESDVEFDYEGVIEPDNDPPQVMGSNDKEVSEEDVEKCDEKKREAVECYNQGNYEDSIKLYTEAILLNPKSAVLYAKRGQCYLQLMKPNACIRDCTQALEINPDNASAYKFRGRAHRLLGNFLKGAEDLRMACKIDYDEQADEWLKEVTPNAKKIEEHQRKYERKKLEKELKETRERIRKMKEEQQKRAGDGKGDGKSESRGDSDSDGNGGGGSGGTGGMENMWELLKDPEILAAFSDPEVVEAFRDVVRSPGNILKYQNNPNVNKILQKLSAKFEDKIPGGLRGFAQSAAGAAPGAPGAPGAPDAAPSSTSSPPPPPPPPPSTAAAADVDLD